MKISFVAILLFLCIAHTTSMGDTVFAPMSPRVVVYKTKRNYNKYVPVTLSEDRKSIVVYPGPRDVFKNGKLAYPTKLAKGYLLDNRGINIHSAFLDITYKEYSQLKEIDPRELMHHIKSYDPFVSLYVCDKADTFTDIVKELNAKIRQGKLKECECLSKP
jgi:hypothetical protein